MGESAERGSDYWSYSPIQVTLLRILKNSFLLKTEDGREVFVARSCVHGADERRIAGLDPPQEVELRVFEWLVEKEGL